MSDRVIPLDEAIKSRDAQPVYDVIIESRRFLRIQPGLLKLYSDEK